MSSRKRAKPGTTPENEEEDLPSGGFLADLRRHIPKFSSATSSAMDHGAGSETNMQLSSVASTQDSPQSFLTQEGMAVAHPEASKRELNFETANDPHAADDEDIGDHDLDDDHDESSYSSAISSSEDEEVAVNSMTLLEKRQRNKERNALRHQQLFSDYQALAGNSEKSSKAKTKTGQYESDNDENDAKPRARGMLMKKSSGPLTLPKSFFHRVQDLEEQYPHREPQIRRLSSLFQSTIGQVSRRSQQNPQQSSGFVPAPLFVIGSTGTGKTSVVRDALDLARAYSSPTTSSTNRIPQSEVALINCATLDPATIGRLTVSISQQLRPSLKRRGPSSKTKQRKRKRKRKQIQGSDVATLTAASNNLDEKGEGSSEGNTQKQPQHAATNNNDDINQETMRRVQPTRAAKVMDTDDSWKHTMASKTNSNDPHNDGEDGTKATDRIESQHSAVMALGRSLQPYYGSRSKRCGFVILDQGPERLLTMSSSDGRNEKSNVLAELLLLPRVMQLNICFIVITTNRLLPVSRLNNIAGPTKASATLTTALRPIFIQFPAYKGNDSFKKILKSYRVQDTITGSYTKTLSCKKEFFAKLVDTFLSSLIQFLSDSTRDINDYLRVGRSLWPVFIRPIHPNNIRGTLKVIAPQALATSNAVDPIIETKILNHLGQKILRFTSTMSSDDPTGLVLDLLKHKKPCQMNELKLTYLQLCLLLAAFICQSNRTDQDKKFFAAQGNGKKRKNKNAQQGEGETVAFSASANEVKQLQSLRPRPFQLERVLSIFVTLVRLNPRDAGIFADMDEERIQTLGSTRLDMDLKQLVDLGFLHPAGAAGRQVNENLDRARFWCSLTRDEANRIAKRASIPLDNYML